MFILGVFVRICIIFYMAKAIRFLFVVMIEHGY